MRKTLLLLLLTAVTAVNAQKIDRKEVTLPLKYHEAFVIMSSHNIFKWVDAPEVFYEVSENGVFKYLEAENKGYIYRIMSDDEIRILRNENWVYYLRYINGSVIGYSLGNTVGDDVDFKVYNTKKFVYDATLKKK